MVTKVMFSTNSSDASGLRYQGGGPYRPPPVHDWPKKTSVLIGLSRDHLESFLYHKGKRITIVQAFNLLHFFEPIIQQLYNFSWSVVLCVIGWKKFRKMNLYYIALWCYRRNLDGLGFLIFMSHTFFTVLILLLYVLPTCC